MWPAQFGRKLVLGTRPNWPRPRRDRDVDNFSRDEIETRRWYVWRPSRDRDHNPVVYSIKTVINYFHILTHNFNLAFRYIISLCLVAVWQVVLHEYERMNEWMNESSVGDTVEPYDIWPTRRHKYRWAKCQIMTFGRWRDALESRNCNIL